MFVLPAIDILDGRAVRLRQGDVSKPEDYGDPVEMARSFESQGAKWVHIDDLDGAQEGYPVHTTIIAGIIEQTSLKIELGGGIRTLEAAKMLIEAGVHRVVISTRLTQDESCASGFFSCLGNRAVAAIDTRDGKIATNGWRSSTAIDGVDFAKHMEHLGCRRAIFTDVNLDGMMMGPNFDAVQALVDRLEIPVIASGGVSSLDDLARLREIGVEAAVVGKALYENHFQLSEAIEISA